MNDDVKKLYEVSFLAKDESGAAAMTGYLTRFGAENLKTAELKKIKLAYPIKKETSAYLGSIMCELAMDTVAKVNDAVKLDKEIIRILVVEPQLFSAEATETPSSRAPREMDRGTRRKTVKKEEAESEAISNELLEEKLEEILQ